MAKYAQRLLVLFLFLVGCSCGSPPQPKPQPCPTPSFSTVKGVQKAMEATVVVMRRTAEDKWKTQLCAGVAIGRHHVLTAYHCLAKATTPPPEQEESEFDKVMSVIHPPSFVGLPVRLVSYSAWRAANEDSTVATQTEGYVITYDPDVDLALLMTFKPMTQSVGIRATDPVLDEPLFAVGHPVSLSTYGDYTPFEFNLTRGRVSRELRTVLGNKKIVQMDMSIWHGNSGGGLFDDRGDLVGICSQLGTGPTAFFVHRQALVELVSGAVKGYPGLGGTP